MSRESKLRVDEAHHLLDFHIEETSAGLVVHARIDGSAASSKVLVSTILSQINSLKSQLDRLAAEGGAETYDSRFVMSIDADRIAEGELGADDEPFAESGFVESDDLIPDAPERPSGRIAVHLKKIDFDDPLPAESPWAD